MGCASSQPRPPDGDGTNALYWAVDELVTSKAGTNMASALDAQILVNQQGLFQMMTRGHTTLPFHDPTDNLVERATTELENAWHCRILVNQQAMLRHLQGHGKISELPYLPDTKIEQRAKTNYERATTAEILCNQTAIFRAMTGRRVESLPFTANKLEQERAGTIYKGACGFRVLMNQETLYAKALKIGHEITQAK